jgi:hypothetical protein
VGALARVFATGDRPVVLAGPEPLLGGISAPALALAAGGAFSPLTPRS